MSVFDNSLKPLFVRVTAFCVNHFYIINIVTFIINIVFLSKKGKILKYRGKWDCHALINLGSQWQREEEKRKVIQKDRFPLSREWQMGAGITQRMCPDDIECTGMTLAMKFTRK
jgi:hypothetical protein